MLKYFFAKESGYNQIFTNGFYLGINYFLNFAIPILITPYVVNILGLSKYGMISVALVICQYFSVIVDYGFNLTATRDISVNSANKFLVDKVTCTALILKTIILVGSFLLYVSIILTVPYLRNNYEVFLLSFTLVIGQGISTNWFFQGIQKLGIMAFVNVVFKVSAAVSIFFIIRAESDFLWVNFILGLGNSLASVALILYIFLKLKVQFILPTMSDLLDGLRPGWDIFLANFYISLYNNSNILILSLFVSNEIVGIYSVIDKVINVFRQIIGVLLQSVYPTACKLAEESVTSVVQFLKPLWRRLSFGVLAISFLIMFYSKEILTFVIGNENALAETYLTILAIIPIVVFYSTYFVAVILSYNNTSVYKKIFMYAAILNILTNLVLAYFFKIKGTIITVFVSEIFILVVTMRVYKKLF